MRSRLLLILILLLFSVPTLLFAATYDHKIDKGTMVFEWKVKGKKLHIKLRAKTKGWVGIGFNPTKKMKGANILIGRVKRGKASIRDDFGSGLEKHTSDKKKGGKKNVSKISGKEKGGYTVLRFIIPLNSGDSKDTVIQPNGDTIVMLAYGNSDSYRLGHTFFKKVKVNLITGQHE